MLPLVRQVNRDCADTADRHNRASEIHNIIVEAHTGHQPVVKKTPVKRDTMVVEATEIVIPEALDFLR